MKKIIKLVILKIMEDKKFELVYKSYDILIKNLEFIDYDSLLDLAFEYLDLRLLWVDILKNGVFEVNKAKGSARSYIFDDTLRPYQIKFLESKKGQGIYVSNNIFLDNNLSFLWEKARTYNFKSIFLFGFIIDTDTYGFVGFYSDKENYFDERTQEILTNFCFAIKSALLLSKFYSEKLLLSDVLENSMQGIAITNDKNEIIFVNKAFQTITGYSFEEVRGKTPSILKSGYHSRDFYKHMWEKITKEGHFEGKIFNKRKNGEIYEEFININTIKDKDGKVLYYTSFFNDLTELRYLKDQVNYLFYHDSLTKLSNKEGFIEQLEGIIQKNESFAVIYIDIDNLTMINSKYGIDKSDELLKQFAEFLKSDIADPKDVVSRFGGDEFVMIKRGIIENNIARFAQETVNKIRNKAFVIDNDSIYITVSAGIVLFPKDAISTKDLLQYAQSACRQAKEKGKNQCVFFNQGIYNEFLQSYTIINEVLQSLKQEHFELYFQPIYSISSKHITGAESLIRWNHPTEGLLSPYYFIPQIENTFAIEQLDFYVLDKAMESIRDFIDQGLELKISVNVTGRTFLLDDFPKKFLDIFKKHNIDPSYLKIELTENVSLSDEQKVLKHMNFLIELGVSFSMDDFGTGFSSILNLKKFPFKNIKIDQNFIKDSDQSSTIISYKLIDMLKALKFETTAEGIENEYLFFTYSLSGCDLLQGYYISKPLPKKEFIEFLRSFKVDDDFLEIYGNTKKIIDYEAIKAKYYIYRYFKNVKSAVKENKKLDLIELDTKSCDFGKWLYNINYNHKNAEKFKYIETLHDEVHKTTHDILTSQSKALLDKLKDQIIKLNLAFDGFYLENF